MIFCSRETMMTIQSFDLLTGPWINKSRGEFHWKIWSINKIPYFFQFRGIQWMPYALNSIEQNSEEGIDTFAISPPPTLRKMRSWPNTTKIGRKWSNDSVSHSTLYLATKQSTKYKSSLLIRCFCPIHAPKPCFTSHQNQWCQLYFLIKAVQPQKTGKKIIRFQHDISRSNLSNTKTVSHECQISSIKQVHDKSQKNTISKFNSSPLEKLPNLPTIVAFFRGS